MTFLADENVPGAGVLLLCRAGYDVELVGDVDRSAVDTAVLARARREGRVLPTFDRDFGELTFTHDAPPPPGVVSFRTDPAVVALPANRLLALLADPETEMEGVFTVVDSETIRQRPPST